MAVQMHFSRWGAGSKILKTHLTLKEMKTIFKVFAASISLILLFPQCEKEPVLIYIADDNYLKSLDVSNNRHLWALWCQRNQLTNIDISGLNNLLEWFTCSGNQLISLNISNNKVLRHLTLENMPFPPKGLEISTEGSPNLYFTTECTK